MKTILKHAGWAALQLGIIILELYMYLRGNGLIEAFDFKDIFFKGGVFDGLRFYDMRMSVMWTIMQFVSVSGLGQGGSESNG